MTVNPFGNVRTWIRFSNDAMSWAYRDKVAANSRNRRSLRSFIETRASKAKQSTSLGRSGVWGGRSCPPGTGPQHRLVRGGQRLVLRRRRLPQRRLPQRRSRLYVEDSVGCRRVHGLQQVQGDVIDGNTADGLAFAAAVMRMAMQDQVRAVTIHHFRKA